MEERQIVTAQEMRELDQLTMKKKNISSIELMIHVGKIIATNICEKGLCGGRDKGLVVAGIGNNGGDALVIATEMINKGFTPRIALIGSEDKQTEEARDIWKRAKKLSSSTIVVSSTMDIANFQDYVNESSLIIDGIFGIGLSKDVTGYHKEVINIINQSYAPVISVDIPSGINADSGLVCGVAVQASHTFVIQNYKQGNLINDAPDFSGILHLLDVGILQLLFPRRQNILPFKYLINKIPKRLNNTHKYHYGNILTIGGSKGMMGAPLLSAMSALRTGSGLSHVLYYEKYLPHISNPYPTIMVDTFKNIDEVDFNKISAVVFGPGLNKNDNINEDILKKIMNLDIPLLIDAGGVYFLKQLLKEDGVYRNIVLTPHYGEMAFLLDQTSSYVEKNPLKCAKDISLKYGITVVLKGVTTIITNYQETYFSKNGNPGMATAGTGDVLCGIIGSLLGRDFTPLEASKLGVLIHGMASKYAMEKYGEESMIASDIIDFIHKILKEITI